MPKYIFILKRVQKIINNFYSLVFKKSLIGTFILVILISTLWTQDSLAEAPLPTQADSQQFVTAPSLELSVDGLTVAERAAKIDAFYVNEGDLPLAGHGLAMVESADRYGIDWRLIAAIGYIESTGGKHACKRVSYSAFGWGSCKIDFSSYEESIDVISKNLGGHNPRTATHYKNKKTADILDSYNPPTVKPNYKKLVFKTMDEISVIDAPAILVRK
jgi:hypothetical protein